jgi:spore maturation protein CgeB
MRWDYGDEARGLSFEWLNFYESLEAMPEVTLGHFDFMAAHRRGGSVAVTAGLRAAIDEFDPRLVFFVLYEDEIPGDVLAELRDRPGLTTFNWFADDHWRLDDYSSVYAPLFTAVGTTARSALEKYQARGIDNVIKTQWACNPHRYRPTGRPCSIELSFVGQQHGDRAWVARRLRRAGLPLQAWGARWPSGRLEADEMVSTFAESRVNLNLTNASNDPRVPRLVRGVCNRIYPPALRWFGGGLEQIKGRTFEIPACGGFQLSGWADDIESYFEPDEEIVLFHSVDELIEKAGRYLRDEQRRAAIAEAGYRRTLAEHTYERRFREIFRTLDL